VDAHQFGAGLQRLVGAHVAADARSPRRIIHGDETIPSVGGAGGWFKTRLPHPALPSPGPPRHAHAFARQTSRFGAHHCCTAHGVSRDMLSRSCSTWPVGEEVGMGVGGRPGPQWRYSTPCFQGRPPAQCCPLPHSALQAPVARATVNPQ
jgi:hypothetical protein